MRYFLYFFISLSTVSLLLYITFRNWNSFSSGTLPLAEGGKIILFLGGITAVIFYLLLQRSRKGPEKFVNFYLGSIVLKLAASSIFILILIYRNEKAAEVNAIFFMITYLLFTALEIVFLVNRKAPGKV